MKQIVMAAVCLAAGALLGGCASDTGGRRTGGDPSEGAGAACASTTDCPSGQACVVVQGIGACSLSCSASGNECSGEASCEGVGSVSADYCQQPPPSSSEPDAAPQPDEEPYIPCTSDADCAAIEAGAVCALHLGARGCTVPCTTRSECNPPTVSGITVDFYDCIPDEGDDSRTVCLLDEACLNASDPLACVTIETAPPTDPPFPDTPEI